MTALVAGTFDTKGAELSYIADLIEAAGLPVQTADLSTGSPPSSCDKYAGGEGASSIGRSDQWRNQGRPPNTRGIFGQMKEPWVVQGGEVSPVR